MLSPTRALRTHLAAWLQANIGPYLQTVGAVEGIDLAPIRTWARVADYATVPEEHLPACYLTTGAASVAFTDPDGTMWVDLTCRVVMVATGRDRVESEDRAVLYTDAARYTLGQDVTLGGAIRSLDVTGWAPAGSALSDGTNQTYRAAHDLTVVATCATSRRAPTVDPVIHAPIVLQLDRLPQEP